MHYHVYFNVGGRLRGPFDSTAANRAEMLYQAATVREELHLPPETVVVIEVDGGGNKQHNKLLIGAALGMSTMIMAFATKIYAMTYGACLICSTLP